MKILLIKPYNLSDHIQPSLGLGYLATAVRDKNEVRILDCIKEKVNINHLGKIVRNYKPDLVGLQCYTFDLKFIKEALSIIKTINENIITAIGGPHSSALPNETMEYFGDELNFAFRGECEKSFPIFVNYLRDEKDIHLSNIGGLIWRENGVIKANDYFFEEDLDSLGIPSWDLIHPETYPESQHGAFYKKFPIAPIMLTRGCPYQCTFCAGKLVSGRWLRKRSIPNVLWEINILYKDYGIREFHIIDDNFSFDKSYAKDFLRQLIKQNLDISWATPNGIRVDHLDEELLDLMKQSGLYLISLGIESGSDKILKLMKKNQDIKKIKDNVRLIRRYGINIAGFFIIGFPRETRNDILKTIEFSLELDLIRANYFTYLPFPGTESYRKIVEDGEIKKVDWDRFYFMSAAYAPKGITRQELKKLQRLAFLKFYLRPKILWVNLIGIKSFRHFLYLLKRFYHWLIMD